MAERIRWGGLQWCKRATFASLTVDRVSKGRCIFHIYDFHCQYMGEGRQEVSIAVRSSNVLFEKVIIRRHTSSEVWKSPPERASVLHGQWPLSPNEEGKLCKSKHQVYVLEDYFGSVHSAASPIWSDDFEPNMRQKMLISSLLLLKK